MGIALPVRATPHGACSLARPNLWLDLGVILGLFLSLLTCGGVDEMDKRKFVVPLAILLLGAIGQIWPRLTITTNIESFQGEERAFAASAWVESRYFFSGSAESLFWTAIRVEDVETKATQESETCYEAVVRAYTLFSLPWSSVLVSSCNSGSIVRQQWGLAPFEPSGE